LKIQFQDETTYIPPTYTLVNFKTIPTVLTYYCYSHHFLNSFVIIFGLILLNLLYKLLCIQPGLSSSKLTN